jgi:hypothetical protein
MMQEGIYTLIDMLLRDIRPVDWVSQKESWIITEAEGKDPRLERARYFSFWNRRKDYDESRVDVIVTTPEMEDTVISYVRQRLGLIRYSPGKDDSKSLIGVWA